MYDNDSVTTVNVSTKPRVIPNGLRFPPVLPADNTIGKSGQIHGAAMVMMPDKNVNTSNKIMVSV